MAAVRMSFEALRKAEFPRSKIADITRAIAAKDFPEVTRLTKGLDDLPKTAQAELAKLKSEFGEKAVWLHLAELWDYLAHAKELRA